MLSLPTSILIFVIRVLVGDSLLNSDIASRVWRGHGRTMLNELFYVTASLTFPNLVFKLRLNTLASISELGKQMRHGRLCVEVVSKAISFILDLTSSFLIFSSFSEIYLLRDHTERSDDSLMLPRWQLEMQQL